MSRALKLSLVTAGAAGVAFLVGFGVFATAILHYDKGMPTAGDAVVVLTGGELRVREGFRLFTAGAGRRILISGVNRATSKLELQRRSGVTPILFNCCVDVDYAAKDTVGNAAETRAWLQTWGFRRLVVVTSNYHMPRSLLELKRTLPGVELVPYAVVSSNYQADQWWRKPAAVKLVMTEYIKFWPSAVRWSASTLRIKFAATPPPQPLPVSPPPEVTSFLPRLSGL